MSQLPDVSQEKAELRLETAGVCGEDVRYGFVAWHKESEVGANRRQNNRIWRTRDFIQ
jgi:hypothetical protein